MFKSIAKQWVSELQSKGKLSEIDPEILDVLISDYAERLENIVNAGIIEEIEKSGKLNEWEKILDYNNLNTQVYLKRLIPNYESFLNNLINYAKNRIAGI